MRPVLTPVTHILLNSSAAAQLERDQIVENVCLGAVQRAKSYADSAFVAGYTIATYKTADFARQALINAGAMAVAASPSGVGAATLSSAAIEELARSVAFAGVSYLSGMMTQRSIDNVMQNIGKLKEMNGYNVREMSDDEAIASGITDVTEAEAMIQGRPSWRQSETDAEKQFPGYGTGLWVGL